MALPNVDVVSDADVARLSSYVRGGGLLVLIGGIVLLTPGLLTDLAGFALMVPGFRALIRERVKKKFAAQVGHFRAPSPGRTGTRPNGPVHHPKDDDVIDV